MNQGQGRQFTEKLFNRKQWKI